MLFNFLDAVEKNKSEFFTFINLLSKHEKKFLILGDISEVYNNFLSENPDAGSGIDELVKLMQEAICFDHSMFLDVRVSIGISEFYYVGLEDIIIEKITIREFLQAKERFVNPFLENDILSINFKPFYEKSPRVRDTNSIGAGVEYLNRFLSSQMFNKVDKWKSILFNFIKLHKHDNSQLVLNDRLKSPDDLNKNIKKALQVLSPLEDETPFEDFKHDLQSLGFEKGIGKDKQTVEVTLKLMNDLITSPDHISLKSFLNRIPMIFNVLVISVHGYFAQEGVLGMPDTGGQLVYIFDQVRALEKNLIESLKEAGIEAKPRIIILTRLIPNAGKTSCNKRLEKVFNTKNTWILRVPFREHNKNVTDNWISRFEIWPYLQEFAEDSYTALKAEFNDRPDLIIGNYSDGNLVSYLLSQKFNVTQCCIAHALEKSKYLFSDLYWQNLEQYYNFSLQFTADLIAMNSSDFQITSTYQEIAGTDYSVGQYETHKHFTMPGLFRVENGVDLYDTKFNIISPGVNERIYFPYSKTNKRIKGTRDEFEKLIFDNVENDEIYGTLENPYLLPIFSMARLDKSKNITSLVRWFGESKELQDLSNLVIVAGKVNPDNSDDREEIEQIHLMYEYINKYNLHNKIRWIGKLLRKDEAAETYRIIADRKGIFVQPALFEGFGLTVLEAMISGLPVVATRYGGPLEIIQHNKNGFHIDPVDDQDSISVLVEVVRKFNDDKEFWKKISNNSIKRVNESYNWKLYSEKLLSLAKIYGFWKFSTGFKNEDMSAYLEIMYHLLYKPRAQQLLEKQNQR